MFVKPISAQASLLLILKFSRMAVTKHFRVDVEKYQEKIGDL